VLQLAQLLARRVQLPEQRQLVQRPVPPLVRL
jgi:hypothetical protein